MAPKAARPSARFTSILAIVFSTGIILRVGADRRLGEAGNSEDIPDWKLDLATGVGVNWWTKFGKATSSMGSNIKSALWGTGRPDVTSSPGQDLQRCPVIKLPDDFVAAAKSRSWTSLYGEWNTANNVNLATWEQNYLGMGFSRNIARMGINIRAASSGQIAIRSRLLTDKEMLTLYDWKEPTNRTANLNASKATNSTAIKEYSFNLAIFDCMGTLMYVVKEMTEYPHYINLYSRDGLLISKSRTGSPVLRYQFADSSGHLIATAEAPGFKAHINRTDIPENVEVAGVVPFGLHYEKGGYKNSSALMESEYRWVLATAVQVLTIFKAQQGEVPWTIVTAVETFLIACIVASALAAVGVVFCTYRLVHPHGYSASKYHDGRIDENGFLASPLQPLNRNYSTYYKTV